MRRRTGPRLALDGQAAWNGLRDPEPSRKRLRIGETVEKSPQRGEIILAQRDTGTMGGVGDRHALNGVVKHAPIIHTDQIGQNRLVSIERIRIHRIRVMSEKGCQIAKRSGMTVRRGRRHIAQGRCPESVSVFHASGHPHPALIPGMGFETRRLAGPELRLAHGVKRMVRLKRSGVAGITPAPAVKQLHPLRSPDRQLFLAAQKGGKRCIWPPR